MVELFIVGFPKSGTSTITKALNSAGIRAAHWRIGPDQYCGQLIYEDYRAGRDPLGRLGAFQCIAQADVCRPGRTTSSGDPLNFWPQLDFDVLDAIEEFHPDIKFILNTRDMFDLIRSITKWNTLRERITQSDIIGLPPGAGARDEDLARWIGGHYAACRLHFHGRDNFLDFDIAAPDARARLAEFAGVKLPWWGVANANAAPASPPH